MEQLLDIETELDIHSDRVEKLNTLHAIRAELPQKDQGFAHSLIGQFLETHTLSQKQWARVTNLVARIKQAEPLYGDFNAIQVMFQIAGEHIKIPKIRLLSHEDTYVELRFIDRKEIKVFRDGWQGHGCRKFCGWIKKDRIIPYNMERMTPDVRAIIQELALDPQACARAMASKLGACMYCGQRLSDQESKTRGYGPVCADHFGQPWGSAPAPITRITGLVNQMSDVEKARLLSQLAKEV